MTRYDAVNYISHGIAKRAGLSESKPVRGIDEDTDTKPGDDTKKKGDALEATPGAIMFIDEIHTVIGAGATSGGAMDASNLLKPALAGGTLRCIGSTTYKEYRQYFEKDRALVRRFQKIDVNEPTIPDAIEILKGLKPYFEDYHRLKYTNEAIKAAVELSARYIHDRKL